MNIGFARADITPADGLFIAGTRPWRRADGVMSPLCGRVLLADDGTHRVAVVCLDLMALPADGVAELRTRLAGAGRLDPDAILVACSHTHSAPVTYLALAPDEDAVVRYRDDVSEALASAMTHAVTDLRPATLAVGRVPAPGWAFNRRPIYANGEVGSHGPAAGDGFRGMEDVADEDLAVLLIRGRDGAIRGGLINFACHPTCMELEVPYSADYAGELVTALEHRYGGTFGFLLGAAGDTAPNDPTKIFADPEHGLGAAHARAMGQALAERAEAAISAARRVTAARVAAQSTRLQIAQRTPTTQQVELARWYLETAPDTVDERAFTRQLYGHDYTFGGTDAFAPGANEYYVRELLGMWEWRRRAGVAALIDEVELQVVLLGDVALVAYPVEGDIGPDVQVATNCGILAKTCFGESVRSCGQDDSIVARGSVGVHYRRAQAASVQQCIPAYTVGRRLVGAVQGSGNLDHGVGPHLRRVQQPDAQRVTANASQLYQATPYTDQVALFHVVHPSDTAGLTRLSSPARFQHPHGHCLTLFVHAGTANRICRQQHQVALAPA